MSESPHDGPASEAHAREEETLEQAGLSADELKARRKALAHVRQWGDPVLRSETRPVEIFDEELRAEATRMIELMDEALGIGLAAPQVGKSVSLLVYRVGDARPIVLANPEIEYSSDDAETAQEGCLSLANVQVDVDRPVHVRVVGKDVTGETIKIEASGLEARVIQHEMDHLDGVLIIDRASKDQRREALRALREAESRSGYAA
ncbi:MAG: peptide deformylase [Actinobacteria bacterium]|nr:peptide deformylase [Actinomycetota bacterium]